MFYLFRFDSVSPPGEGKSNQRWKIDGIHAATHSDFIHMYMYTLYRPHTHTSSSTCTYSHPCRAIQCARKIAGLLSHKCFVRALSFAPPPRDFSKIHAYKRDFTVAICICVLSREQRLRKSPRNAPRMCRQFFFFFYQGACQVIALLRVSLYRLAHFYGIFDTLRRRHARVPTCRKLIWQK